ncbi:GTPase HflX [Rubellimicrobium sp. CFH 75288]|uniref:GTPase HflX n=1 Tax=Rubellimicrobium sp. CFH 75288 TaxID=2697034 RepID=UPI001411F52D|nr:GTPase HflX [Rubellimicrobium sp. CFH 75288]NAZ36904.1 GTPase HflX [Rubellimicrobium sp. CFH 75288]
MPSTAVKRTPAWLLHPDIKADRAARPAEPALEEAVALAAALPELDLRGAEIVRLPRVHPGMLFGSGKIAELKARFAESGVELVLVDGPVSPVQQRNLEKEWGVKLLDRTGLILEIFADRARTREGVLQVEMAALSYQRTRLVRSWTHLERQRGGFGFVGGPGETQIEADRRAIDDQLVRLRRQLDRVVQTRTLHRAARAKVPFPVVALVGYTNAGKSTLFNRLTGSDVVARDMLFATLDPTMRRVRLPSGLDVILSDTVGFISDLPTELVAAFRATLEEVLDADLILHVRDIGHPQSEAQARDVETILQTLGVAETTPLIEVWNKIDLLPPEDRPAAPARPDRDPAVFPVSALTGEGLEALLAAVTRLLDEPRTEDELLLPHGDGRRRAWLHEHRLVLAERTEEEGTRLRVCWTARQRDRFALL